MPSLRRSALFLCTLLFAVGCDADDREDVADALALDGTALEDRPLTDDDGEDPGDPLPAPAVAVTARPDATPCAPSEPHGAPLPLAGAVADDEPFDPGALNLDLAALADAEDAPAPAALGPDAFAAEDDEPEPCDTHGGDDDDVQIAG